MDMPVLHTARCEVSSNLLPLGIHPSHAATLYLAVYCGGIACTTLLERWVYAVQLIPVHVFCGLSSSLSGWRCSFGRAPVSVFENPMHTSVTLRTRAHKKVLLTEIELDHVALFSRWYAAYVSRVGISALSTVYPVSSQKKWGALVDCLPA